MAGDMLADARIGRNGRHALAGLLWQSVFGRLTGDEDVNDAERLRYDPARQGRRTKVDRSHQLKTIVLTVSTCLALAMFGIVGFIYSGLYDVAALNPDNFLVAWVVREMHDRSVAVRLRDIQVPPGLDKPEVVMTGAKFYTAHCVVCHGGPGLQPTDIALGVNPAPSNLFDAAHRMSIDETFWVIKNGVKMTAMPGFGKTHSDGEIWAIAAFLRTAHGMSPQDFAEKTKIGLPVTDKKPGSG